MIIFDFFKSKIFFNTNSFYFFIICVALNFSSKNLYIISISMFYLLRHFLFYLLRHFADLINLAFMWNNNLLCVFCLTKFYMKNYWLFSVDIVFRWEYWFCFLMIFQINGKDFIIQKIYNILSKINNMI